MFNQKQHKMKATVIKSTASSNGGYVTTLGVAEQIAGLGSVQGKRYIKTAEQAKVGAEFELNPAMFTERVQVSKIVDQKTGEERDQTMIWLSLKVSA